MTRLLLFGTGGHARACIDVIEQDGRYAIAGLTGVAAEVGSAVLGYPVLGTDADAPGLLEPGVVGLVTIGQIKTPEARMRLFEVLYRHGRVVPAVVSPRAYVSRHATVGAGSIVMHGAVINAGASIGQNCIVNSQALIEHDSTVADHCHVSTGAKVNSGVRIGAGTFVGSNASVRQGVTIGARCVIGMAQVVLSDHPEGSHLPRRRAAL